MSKEAKTNNNKIHSLLEKRWSPRAFEDRPVEFEKLNNILEAARWSPSASNIQPWIYFIGLKGDPTYDMIFESLVEFNQMWLLATPVLILNCGKTTTDDGSPNMATPLRRHARAVRRTRAMAIAEAREKLVS